MTVHGVFPDFQKARFNKSDLCLCKQYSGTLEHIIYDWYLWNNIRAEYLSGVTADILKKELLLHKCSSIGIRLIIQAYVKAVLP